VDVILPKMCSAFHDVELIMEMICDLSNQQFIKGCWLLLESLMLLVSHKFNTLTNNIQKRTIIFSGFTCKNEAIIIWIVFFYKISAIS
jgi:hypothetical protein